MLLLGEVQDLLRELPGPSGQLLGALSPDGGEGRRRVGVPDDAPVPQLSPVLLQGPQERLELLPVDVGLGVFRCSRGLDALPLLPRQVDEEAKTPIARVRGERCRDRGRLEGELRRCPEPLAPPEEILSGLALGAEEAPVPSRGHEVQEAPYMPHRGADGFSEEAKLPDDSPPRGSGLGVPKEVLDCSAILCAPLLRHPDCLLLGIPQEADELDLPCWSDLLLRGDDHAETLE